MSAVGDILNLLGQEIVPGIAEIVFPDTVKILQPVQTQGAGGGIISSFQPLQVNNADLIIPCAAKPKPKLKDFESEKAGRIVSIVEYILKIPTNHNGTRINLQIGDRLQMQSRGNEPVKLFRIMAIPNKSGVIYEVVGELEN